MCGWPRTTTWWLRGPGGANRRPRDNRSPSTSSRMTCSPSTPRRALALWAKPQPLNARTLKYWRGRLPVPAYDRSLVTPGVVHVGVGGFHRAHQAMYHDRLMNQGIALDWGICGVGVMPADQRMKQVLDAQDGLYTLVLKHGDGTWEPRIIGSIVQYLFAPDDPEAVIEKMAAPATRIISLTITEGGYNVNDTTGEFDTANPEVLADLEPGAVPRTTFALITEALSRRRKRGEAPFTVMSCDNLQDNGYRARRAFTAFARLRDPDLAAWVQVVDHVESYELMKLRLLNGSHQAMAYFAYLCGYRLVHEAAQDPLFQAFLLGYMNEEATPTLPPVPGVDLTEYKHTLIERFSNPQVRDTIARLCAESSDRIPKWLLPVVRQQLATGGEIRHSAAVVASWARYAEGVDEAGQPIEVVDRLRDSLMPLARRQREDPDAFIANRDVFGDLADQERFATAYTSTLVSLHQRGARA